MKSVSLGIVLALALAVRNASADFNPEERANRGVVPLAIRDRIKADFPGFALPSEGDLSGRWGVFKSRYDWLPYLATGDFNEDGETDYATLLVGEHEWRFIVFQSDGRNGFKPIPVQSGEIPGQGAYSYPHALRLRTIKKGQTYNPEDSDNLVQMTPRRDILELRDDNRGTWLFQYANGRYTDFLWNRGPSLGFATTIN